LRFDAQHQNIRLAGGETIVIGGADAVTFRQFSASGGARIGSQYLLRFNQFMDENTFDHGFAHIACADKADGLICKHIVWVVNGGG